MEPLLKQIYYTANNPAAFGGVESVYTEAKKVNPTITRKIVKDWMSKQYTYTLHKPVRRKFNRSKVYVDGIDDQFQIDLADMQSISKYNNNFKYLLTCIDVFSKYAWAIPVYNKSGREIVRGFKLILSQRQPKKVQSDKGREFLNEEFQKLLRECKIRFFTSENNDIKCAVVERFNRTIKSKIWKYFTAKRTYKYIDVISDLVDGYNNSYHRSIKMKPNDVGRHNENVVRKNLYGKVQSRKSIKFSVGDKVRISKIKGTFEKGYLPNWSEEVFFVRKILKTKTPTMYILEDYDGDKILGHWYSEELQKVFVDKYWVEKIIKKDRRGGKLQYFVKWSGYPDKFNSWISRTDLRENV